MIESHKRLLLAGCRESFGRRCPDSVRIVCGDGRTYINVLILASVMPWLKEELLQQLLYRYNQALV
jgi:hypothetical protein